MRSFLTRPWQWTTSCSWHASAALFSTKAHNIKAFFSRVRWSRMSNCSANQTFKQPCNFLTAITKYEDIYEFEFPEVAFAGRSNVGKSSLMNAIMNRHGLVRTSKRPGRTQQLNFFQCDSGLILVDMPGYGFAKVSLAAKQEWSQLIHDYVVYRASDDCLITIFVLIDSRHGVKENDKLFLEFLQRNNTPFEIILTKCDKAGDFHMKRTTLDIMKYFSTNGWTIDPQNIHPTSASSGHGIADLQATIARKTIEFTKSKKERAKVVPESTLS